MAKDKALLQFSSLVASIVASDAIEKTPIQDVNPHFYLRIRIHKMKKEI